MNFYFQVVYIFKNQIDDPRTSGQNFSRAVGQSRPFCGSAVLRMWLCGSGESHYGLSVGGKWSHAL
jgi:hypothetical protein